MDSEHEELASNPFWQALQGQAKLMTEIARDAAIVCVPAAESLKLCKLSLDFLHTHILCASPHFADTYTTRNGKTCTLKDGRVICRQGFPRPRTVMVVYEELVYDDDFNSIKCLRTNFALEGKIPMGYYKAVASQAALDVSTLNARTLPEHQSVLCRLSGPSFATACTSASPEQALANIGASPSPHLTASTALPSIFSSLQKFVFSFNTSYVLVKGFVDHAGTKVKDACERMKQELGAQAAATAKASSSSSSSGAAKLSRVSSMEASAAIEACIFAGIHRKLFMGLIELYRGEEQRTQALLATCTELSMIDLGVRPELVCDASSAVQHLQQALNGTFAVTPLQKLSVLEDTSRLLTQAVDAQLASARADGATDADVTLAADDMLPFWIYLLIQSRPAGIHATLEYCHHFQSTNPFVNLAQLQVHLANLQAAVQFVDSGRLNRPNASEQQQHPTGPLDARRRSAIVTSSFADLSLRDGSGGTGSGPRSPQRSRAAAHRTSQMLDAIEDGYGEDEAVQPRRANGHPAPAHQRHASSGMHFNSTLSHAPVAPMVRSNRPRTASVSIASSSAATANPFAVAATTASTTGSGIGGMSSGSAVASVAAASPHLVRMRDVRSARSSQDRAAMGEFLSNLQQQDDIVTGRLEKGQTLFGGSTPTTATAANRGEPGNRTAAAQRQVLKLEDDDLPPLIVHRANRR